MGGEALQSGPSLEEAGWGRAYGKGKCTAGRFGYQWKVFPRATQGSRVAVHDLPLLTLPQRKDNVRGIPGIFPGKDSLNNCNPIPREEDV